MTLTRPAADRCRTVLRSILGLAVGLGTASIDAQEFSRFLKCEGVVTAGGQTARAHADFALRFNNRVALIQRSDVLPVGERLSFVASPATYSMTYRLPAHGTKVLAVPGWFSNSIVVLYPDLQRLNEIRLSIDRQSGELEGTLLNEAQSVLGALRMQCQSISEQDLPAPKF
jgi:hypothetical protein